MFEFRVHGKWILAGEHAVLRGSPALVFPVSSRYLQVQYLAGDQDLAVRFEPEHNDLHIGFWSVFERALQFVGRSRTDIKGELKLINNIPIGSGMGASATLCVAIGRLFCHWGLIQEESLFGFAKDLEDLFHGKSSGVDVAVALKNTPLVYRAPGHFAEFKPRWAPHFYLSFSGRRAVTADCVRRVEKLFAENDKLAHSLDGNMQKAVGEAQEALEKGNIELLQTAVERAERCFEGWRLINDELRQHMSDLRERGALAVKPTGSGDGGYVLSLWENEIAKGDFPYEMIACN